MRILEVKNLKLQGVKVIRFARFPDNRGYFAEPFRSSDFFSHPEMRALQGLQFLQSNESYSKANVIRGLHFQWSPIMGKLVRPLFGRMVDMVLDIRKNSPTLGKIILYEMLARRDAEYDEWIWVPPGFAHGNFFTQESLIEYYCAAEYSPSCEAGISPLSEDIDWSLADPNLKKELDAIVQSRALMSDKDKNGMAFTGWMKDERSDNFIFDPAS